MGAVGDAGGLSWDTNNTARVLNVHFRSTNQLPVGNSFQSGNIFAHSRAAPQRSH